MATAEYDPTIDPFVGMEVISSSQPEAYNIPLPQVDAIYVSQPTDQPPTHRVKLATTVKRGKATFYVWECICGASSALHTAESAANESYKAHK